MKLRSTVTIGISIVVGIVLGALTVIVFQSLSLRNDPMGREADQRDFSAINTDNLDLAHDSGEVNIFEEIFSKQGTAQQFIALLETFSQSTEQELMEFWLQSKKLERGSHRETAQHVILLKLSSLNPQQAFQYLDDVSSSQMESLLTVVFSEWAGSQLSEAIVAAATLVGQRRDIVVRTIFQSRDDLSDNDLQEIATRLNRKSTYQQWVSEKQAAQSLVEPQESWNILLSDDVDDHFQRDLLSLVVERWFEKIGFEVLSTIYSEISDYRTRTDLFSAIARLDPAGALNYTLNLEDERERSSVSVTIVQEWARIDARAALTAASMVVPSGLASDMESAITTTWARLKPTEVIEYIANISEDMRLPALQIAFSRVAIQNPTLAIANLSIVEDYVGNTSTILSSIIGQWAIQQPKDAADWVLNNYTGGDPQRRLLLKRVLPSLARQQPHHAFRLALEEPSATERLGLDYVVLREVTREGDIELALEFLPQIGESSKASAYSELATAMIESGNVGGALELGKNLNHITERPHYYKLVFRVWARTDPKAMYNSLKDLPSSETRSIAAQQLIQKNEYSPILTDDEIKLLNTHLSSSDGSR